MRRIPRRETVTISGRVKQLDNGTIQMTLDVDAREPVRFAVEIELEAIRVGMIQLFEHADALEIGEIQIQPSYQGRGIGTRVLRDAIARAHAQGKTVTLSAGLQNHRAIELYRRLGFRCVAQSETHYHMACEPVA